MQRLSLLVFVSALSCGLNYPDTFHPPWSAPEIKLEGAGPYSLEQALREKKPRVTLVFFGFTHCPDICPSTLHRLAQAMKGLSEAEIEKLQVLFISIDPARDTPALAAAYAKKFHPRITGLSGTKDEIDAVAKAYRVYSEAKDGQITHASGIYWINGDGRVSKILKGDFSADKLLSDLHVVLK